MTKQKSTKRALLMSALSLLMCVSMLVGSTFAWFTDSATSGSNVIQSGKLDIVLEYWDGDSWEDAEGKVLEFERAANYSYASQEILWEPGCTFNMPKIRVRNEGNLAAKVAILVNGISGDDKLLEALTFTTTVDPDTANPAVKDWLEQNGNKLAPQPADIGTVLWDEGLAPKGVTANNGVTDTTAEITLSAHMDEDASNEYQNLMVKGISITALASQSPYEADSFDDQYDKDASIVDAIFVHGGTYNMDADRNEGINISAGAEVIVNGNDHAINVDGTGFQNSGNATVNDVEMNAGNAANYSNITIGADAKTIYNNVTVNSAGGGIGAANGAEVIFNSGSVEVNTTSTSGRYLFYAEGEGTVITINGGDFADFTKISQNQKRAYIYAGEGTTVYVNGGTFGKASTRSGYTAGILGSGTVVITGGTFGFDPSAWVAGGYKAINNDGTYFVVPQNVDAVIANAEDLVALGGTKINGNYVLAADIDMTGKTMKSMELSGGATVNFNGNGHIISNLELGAAKIHGMTGTGNEVAGLFDLTAPATTVSLTVSDLTVKNATVSCSGYAAAIVGYNPNGGTVITLNNVDVDGAVITSDSVAALVAYSTGKVNLKNCDVKGLTLTGEAGRPEKVGAYIGTANTASCVVTVTDCTNGTTYNNYGRVINGATYN